MKARFTLINAGLFPEVLPPCFISKDSKRAFSGLTKTLDASQFNDRTTEYIKYSGTKHDGSRRFFGTPNIITYFHISSFIWKNWKAFEDNYALSKYSIGKPKLMDDGAERAVKVPSLSELSKHTSENLRYAPFILKADIAQCFPSLYTHSIPWAIHGIDESKNDTKIKSEANYFNALDFFIRSGQRGNTRGVLVGPDAYRLVAEFILARLDQELQNRVGGIIVGAVRHVDDYYIGLKTEHDAQSVLSHLREILAKYELYLNDQKTRIFSSLEPINDLWAQRLKDHTDNLEEYEFAFKEHENFEKIERAISEAVVTAKEIGSDSPIKILFRSFDQVKIYKSALWPYVEHNLLRIIQKHPHSLDYACLLVVKRSAIGLQINKEDWKDVAESIIKRGLALNHDHEVIWMLWLMIVTSIDISQELSDEMAKSKNGYILAMLVKAYTAGKLKHKPKIKLGAPLQTMTEDWLVNLVAKSEGYSNAAFGGLYAQEFEHLAKRKIKLIDFDDHLKQVKEKGRQAISRVRYGYDDDEDEDDSPDYDFDEDDDNDPSPNPVIEALMKSVPKR